MAMTADNPRNIPSSVVKYRRAELRQFLTRLWALDWFHAQARIIQHAVAWQWDAAIRTNPRLLWTPVEYPSTYQIFPIAVYAADPTGGVGHDVYLQDGCRYIANACQPGPLPDYVHQVAKRLCLALGYEPPTPRDLIYAAMALLWPARGVDDLAEAIPYGPPDSVDRGAGTLHLANDPHKARAAEAAFMERYRQDVSARQRPRVEAFNPAGRAAGRFYSVEEFPVVYAAAYRACATDPMKRRDPDGRPTQLDVAFELGISVDTLDRQRAQDRRKIGLEPLPWPPR